MHAVVAVAVMGHTICVLAFVCIKHSSHCHLNLPGFGVGEGGFCGDRSCCCAGVGGGG